MKITDGRASEKSIMLGTDHLEVTATRLADHSIGIETLERSEKSLDVMIADEGSTKIPILRFAYLIAYLLFGMRLWTVLCFTLGLDLAFRFVPRSMSPEPWILIPSVCIFAFLLSKEVLSFRRGLRYHGAEHAVVNAFDGGIPISLENLRKSDYRSADCGSLLISLVALFFFPLLLTRKITLSFLTSLIVALASLVYIHDHKNGLVAKSVLFVQGKLFCWRPHDEHLEVAMAAFNRLQELDDERAQ